MRRLAFVGILVVATMGFSVGGTRAGPHAWHSQRPPNPTGGTQNELDGVACASTSVCTAVGTYVNGSNVYVTLAERWDGSHWRVQPTPNPQGAQFSILLKVSCPSTTLCIAVGNSTNGSGTTVTLAERWNGSHWRIQSTPNPHGAQSSAFNDVSCPSASLCIAVGHSTDSFSIETTLAERWNGIGWKIQSTPNPPGDTTSLGLRGVDCPSTTLCTAVGAYRTASMVDNALAEQWTGGTWKIQSPPPFPAGSKESALSAVACPSTTLCTAVGTYTDASDVHAALAERWTHGTGWVDQPVPDPSDATSNATPDGVDCPSTSVCIAVGDYSNGSSPQVMLAERWNGTAWKVQTTPSPLGTKSSTLGSVACPSVTLCTAVGDRFNGSDEEVTLAERYS